MPWSPSLELYWIPLGARTRIVRLSGWIYEVAPIPDTAGPRDRGVVAEGPVGLRWHGAWHVFRYEVRRRPAGTIPDLCYAVASPVVLTHDSAVVDQVLDLVPLAPNPVSGRDELDTGEMWNSNSVISWLLTTAGMRPGEPPHNGPPQAGRRALWPQPAMSGDLHKYHHVDTSPLDKSGDDGRPRQPTGVRHEDLADQRLR